MRVPTRAPSLFALLACTSACTSATKETPGSLPPRFVVTADFLAGSVTVLDADLLSTAGSVEDATVRRHPVPFAPGPMQVELARDGRTAIVSVGPGFFDGGGALLVGLTPDDVPPGDAGVLVMDLLTGEATRLPLQHASMGMAVSPDGQRAYVAEFGDKEGKGRHVAIVDLEARTLVTELPVDGIPEQVAVSADGTLVAVSLDGTGAVQVFQARDPAGTLSSAVPVSSDPSGLAFVPGTDRLVVANSLGEPGWAVVDVADPSAPRVVERGTVRGGSPYAAAWVPGSTDVLIARSLTTPGELLRVDATASPTTAAPALPLCNDRRAGFPLGVAVGSGGDRAWVALPGDRSLCEVLLDTGTARRIPWYDESGPTYAAAFPLPW